MVPERRSASALQALRRPRLVAGLALVVAAACLYLYTLDDGLRLEELKGGDLITHQYAQVEGRPSNAPGYPLYTMGGWLWFRVGTAVLGRAFSPIEVLSLYSTIWAVAVLACFYVLALQLGGGRWLLAAAAGAFYAVTYFFWYYAVSTEQYGSAVLQTLVLLLLALRWQRRRDDRYLYWMAFVAGTCLANLVTVAFVLPGIAWFVWSQERGILRRRGLALRLCGLALLPLLSYAYVYVRGAQHPEWRGDGAWPSTWAWFLSFIGTDQGRQEMTLRLLPLDLSYLHLVPDEVTWPVLLGGLVGLALLERHQAVLVYSTLLIYLLFSYVDRYGNWYQVVMPVYPLLVLGCASLVKRAAGLTRRGRALATMAALLLLAAAGERLWTNYPRADLSGAADDNALCFGQSILLDLAHESDPVTVAVTYDEELSLQYLSTVYDVGRHLTIVPPDAVSARVDYMSRAALPLAGSPPATWSRPAAVGAGMLSDAARIVVPDVSHATVGSLDVAVVSHERRYLPDACGGRVAVVGIRWTVRDAVASSFVVSARLLSAGDALDGPGGVPQDDHPPLWGATVVTDWEEGQVWVDSYSFALPDGLVADGLTLIAYTAESGGSDVLWSVDLVLPAAVEAGYPMARR